MQILFLWDSQGNADRALAEQILVDGSDDAEVRRGALDAAAGTWEQRKIIDERLERIAPQWPPRRQPGVDRNLIRLAVWEMTSTDTPPKVAIDEAIEMAKIFLDRAKRFFCKWGAGCGFEGKHRSEGGMTKYETSKPRMKNEIPNSKIEAKALTPADSILLFPVSHFVLRSWNFIRGFEVSHFEF